MSELDLRNRNAIVTGGAQGIGLAIVKRLLAAGASVHIWDCNAEQLRQSLASLSGPVFGVLVDVTDESAIPPAATAAAAAAHGAIDILVNNAGIAGATRPVIDYPLDEWERVLKADLTGPFLCCRAVAPYMVQQKYGRIVNIASIAGKEGNPNAAAYSAAKAGVIALTKSLGKELSRDGVLVNCVTPAAAKTAIFEQMSAQHIEYMLAKIPLGRFVRVEEIAAMVCWLASEECSFTTGGVFDISGGRATY